MERAEIPNLAGDSSVSADSKKFSEIMPKMKTKSGAKKRFKMTGSGQIKREKAYQAHIMTSKSKKRKRNLRQSTLVSSANAKNIRILLAC